MFKPAAAFLGIAAPSAPRAANTADPHGQPLVVMAQAMGRACASPGPAARSDSSANRAAAEASNDSASLSRVPGSARPSAWATPRGVGSTNRAGRVKAYSSRTSKTANGERPKRLAVVLASQTTGRTGGPEPGVRRLAASARGGDSISPSVVSHAARRTPATRAGWAGSIRRGEAAVSSMGVEYSVGKRVRAKRMR